MHTVKVIQLLLTWNLFDHNITQSSRFAHLTLPTRLVLCSITKLNSHQLANPLTSLTSITFSVLNTQPNLDISILTSLKYLNIHSFQFSGNSKSRQLSRLQTSWGLNTSSYLLIQPNLIVSTFLSLNWFSSFSFSSVVTQQNSVTSIGKYLNYLNLYHT